MGSFSGEFIDVTAPPVIAGQILAPLVPTPPGIETPVNYNRLAALIAAVRPRPDAPFTAQATLYFPPGLYKIEAVGRVLRIPDGLTVWLAPGAVLAPTGGLVLTIEGSLTAERQQIFDLSNGGLVIFGTRIERVVPEWWGARRVDGASVPPTRLDSAPAIQQAIDAAVHNRVRVINAMTVGEVLPPIPLEFDGTYALNAGVVVSGERRSIEVYRALGLEFSGGLARFGHALIEGRGAGRAQLGAVLEYEGPAVGIAVLQIVECAGITVRNIGIDCVNPGPPCLALVTSSGPANAGALLNPQGPSFERCRFRGRSRPCVVQVGDPLGTIVPPTGNSAATLIPGRGTNQLDLSVARFVECDIEVVEDGSVGLEFNAVQSLPIRLSELRFSGRASAMIRAWGGSMHVGRCRFDNRRAPSARQTAGANDWTTRLGYEEQDGADIYIGRKPPVAGVMPPRRNEITGLLAAGCVSRSGRFLSTPLPALAAAANDFVRWPVVLVNNRHAPGEEFGQRPGASVYWGQRHDEVEELRLANAQRYMGKAAALVVVGGFYRWGVQVWYGASQSAVVAARSAQPGLPLTLERITDNNSAYKRTEVFGLPVDFRR